MQDSQVLRPAPAKRKQWRRASRSRHNLNDTIACLIAAFGPRSLKHHHSCSPIEGAAKLSF